MCQWCACVFSYVVFTICMSFLIASTCKHKVYFLSKTHTDCLFRVLRYFVLVSYWFPINRSLIYIYCPFISVSLHLICVDIRIHYIVHSFSTDFLLMVIGVHQWFVDFYIKFMIFIFAITCNHWNHMQLLSTIACSCEHYADAFFHLGISWSPDRFPCTFHWCSWVFQLSLINYHWLP